MVEKELPIAPLRGGLQDEGHVLKVYVTHIHAAELSQPHADLKEQRQERFIPAMLDGIEEHGFLVNGYELSRFGAIILVLPQIPAPEWYDWIRPQQALINHKRIKGR